jgi:AGZA family xanthine/uracil permease-like MFS transporter
MSRPAWGPRWGDVNGVFGLLLDNFAALVLLLTLLTSLSYRPDRFTPAFVLAWIIPGTAAGVFLGGLLYAFLAARLARRTGRGDVTAMPVGLDTPSVFAISLFVLLPALAEGRERFADRGLEELDLHHLASVYAWHVAAVVLVLVGLIKTACAPFGQWVRGWVPRAGLLGSLAAIALALIAFLPMARHVAVAPVLGLPALAVILVTLFPRGHAHDRIPGTVLALLLGLALTLVSVWLGEWRGWHFVPLPETSPAQTGAALPLPAEMWGADWWRPVVAVALLKLPVALPFALFTLVGGVECTESAAAAGDEYDARSVLVVQGLASAAAGLLGGVVQTTPYFGHPAYKKMGATWAYAVAATLILAVAGYFGWAVHILEWVPGAILFPVIVYVGLRTIAHSMEVTPPVHYAAVALAAVPVLAYLVVITLDEVLRGRPPGVDAAVLVQTLRCLGNGFILTSLLWATALTAILDGRSARAAVPLLLAAGCSLVGLIHSPLPGAPLAWPQQVWEQLAHQPDSRLQFQSPYHWAAAYVLAAGVVLVEALASSRAGSGKAPEAPPPARTPDEGAGVPV